MTPQYVVVGAAFYKFPSAEKVVAYLDRKMRDGDADPRVDPKDFGAEFVAQAPWHASTLEDCISLREVLTWLAVTEKARAGEKEKQSGSAAASCKHPNWRGNDIGFCPDCGESGGVRS